MSAAPQARPGPQKLCDIKDGWTALLGRDGTVLLTNPGHPPYRIRLDTIQPGDVLPRDTDKPVTREQGASSDIPESD